MVLLTKKPSGAPDETETLDMKCNPTTKAICKRSNGAVETLLDHFKENFGGNHVFWYSTKGFPSPFKNTV